VAAQGTIPKGAEMPQRQTPRIAYERLTEDALVVRLLGEWDLGNVSELRATTADVLDECELLIVDLSQTDFIDSSVVHALLDARQQALCQEKRLILQIGAASIIRRALGISGVMDVIPVVESVEGVEQLLAYLGKQ
jgi:anti-anti-sigma factor